MLSKKKTISAAHNTIEKDEILNYSNSSMQLYVYLAYLQDDSKSFIILFSQDDAIVGIKSIKID